MLQEAFSYLIDQGKASMTPRPVRLPGSPPHIIHVAKPDGTLEPIELAPGYRTLAVHKLDDLIELAQAHFDQDVRDAARMVIAYNTQQVMLVFDHARAVETAVYKFLQTSEYQFMLDRDGNPLIEVRDLRRALRLTLLRAVTDTALIEKVSKLNFEQRNQQQINAQRGRESMGMDIEQAVADDKGLPDEYQTFNIRRWANPDLDVRWPITCLLDPDLESRRWFLKPLEDSMIEFDRAAMGYIGDKLHSDFEDSGVHVYRGAFSQSAGGSEWPGFPLE